MFVKVTQSGGHRYAQRVESFRNEHGQPRQRTICTLGRLKPSGDVDTLINSLNRAQGRNTQANTHPLDALRFWWRFTSLAVTSSWRDLHPQECAHVLSAHEKGPTEVGPLGLQRSVRVSRFRQPRPL
jgi:hypothetical protein